MIDIFKNMVINKALVKTRVGKSIKNVDLDNLPLIHWGDLKDNLDVTLIV